MFRNSVEKKSMRKAGSECAVEINFLSLASLTVRMYELCHDGAKITYVNQTVEKCKGCA